MTRLVLKDIGKEYDRGVKVVAGINISAEPGEFVVLVGPSGCGKSTILRMIAGLEEITSGELFFDETLMNSVEPKYRDIGMVFQNYALYPHMTVFENIAFPLQIKKEKKDAINKKVREVADMIGLGELLQRRPKQLSGGQRQRVALGRAIVRNPRLFLFDEPLSNLDAKLRVQMRTEIISLQKRLGTTSVYVTHDQTEAMTMGDKIAVLKDGKLQQYDSPSELYNNPANEFVAGFLGSPQMNFLEGEIILENGLKFVYDKNIVPIELSERQFVNSKPGELSSVKLGVRPENITPDENHTGDNIISGKTITIEYLGHETLIHFESAGAMICSRIPAGYPVPVNGNPTFSISGESIYLFDNNGLRL